MSKKPKVVHIITRLEPGGSSRNTIDSCLAQTTFYDVTLIHGPHPSGAGLINLLPSEVKRIEIPELRRELCPKKDLAAWRRLKTELAAIKPDLIHTHTSKAGALGRLAAAAYNKTAAKKAVVIHTPHGHLLYGYYGPLRTLAFRLIEIYLAGLTDHFVALTPGEMRETSAAGIGGIKKWAVVHSGVQLAGPAVKVDRQTLGAHQEDTVIGTVARLEKVKGVEYLIRAAAILKQRPLGANPKFVIVGGGELENKLRALSRRLGVDHMTIFTGWRDDVPALMGAFDIYVQPSLNEAMGRAPLEAQAAGVPAVVSAVCGLPDIIEEEKTGLTVPPHDAKALARALERLIIAPKLRARMGAAAKDWALSIDGNGNPRFGPEAMNRLLLALYDKALASR